MTLLQRRYTILNRYPKLWHAAMKIAAVKEWREVSGGGCVDDGDVPFPLLISGRRAGDPASRRSLSTPRVVIWESVNNGIGANVAVAWE